MPDKDSTTRKIIPAEPGSRLLRDVIELGRANAKTLGFFPEGAFKDYASRRQVLACVEDGDLVGYVAFRTRNLTITLVHLCVASDRRGRGIAKTLIDHLSEQFLGFAGILAKCRVDYAANDAWPRLGFTYRNEVDGRATRKPTKLGVWWRDFGLPDLFSTAPSDRIVAALDANVLIDLHGDPSELEQVESKSLLADWLEDSIEYVVTDEVFTEIARNSNAPARRALQKYASGFRSLANTDQGLARQLHRQLTRVIGSGESERDESDHRHVVLSVLGGAHFFLTRDQKLLDFAPDIEKRLGLLIIRPADFIARTHADLTGQSYATTRLSGSTLTMRPYTDVDIDDLVRTFQAFDRRERRPEILSTLRNARAQPTHCDGHIVRGQDGSLQGLLVIRSVDGEARIQLLRTTRGPLSEVLARHLVWFAVQQARQGGYGVIRLMDQHISPAADGVLAVLGFRRAEGGMAKVNGIGVLSAGNLADHLRMIDPGLADPAWMDEVLSPLESEPAEMPTQFAFACERLMWPAKLLDTSLPSYSVPIQPEWAAQLFHTRLAEESLFGSDPRLMLRLDNVYYRSSISRGVEAPARILWYVMDSPERPSTKCYAATSLVEEVVRGPATEIFSRFERYGVFGWKDVLRLANDDPFGQIEAFRFGHTEPFKRLVELSQVRAFAARLRVPEPFLQSPSRVPAELFKAIYQEGFPSDG